MISSEPAAGLLKLAICGGLSTADVQRALKRRSAPNTVPVRKVRRIFMMCLQFIFLDPSPFLRVAGSIQFADFDDLQRALPYSNNFCKPSGATLRKRSVRTTPTLLYTDPK